MCGHIRNEKIQNDCIQGNVYKAPIKRNIYDKNQLRRFDVIIFLKFRSLIMTNNKHKKRLLAMF